MWNGLKERMILLAFGGATCAAICFIAWLADILFGGDCAGSTDWISSASMG